MGERSRRLRNIRILGVLALLAAGRVAAEERNVKSIAAGLAYDHFARTVVWAGDDAASKILTHTLAAKAEIGLTSGLVFSLGAGFSFTDFSGLAFDALPISLEFRGATLKGFTLAAEAAAPIRIFGEFEIGAAGRIVYSFGISRSWPLEEFAVEGRATGQPSWIEVSAGPRVAYLAFGPRIVPFAEVSARMLWAGFRMTEALGELTGEDSKKVRGDFALGLALGADVRVTDHVLVKAKAGIMPYAGGVDSSISVGALYGF
jgi:hypothetical protein